MLFCRVASASGFILSPWVRNWVWRPSISLVRASSSFFLGMNLFCNAVRWRWPSLEATIASWMLIMPTLLGVCVTGADEAPPPFCANALMENSAAGTRNLKSLRVMGVSFDSLDLSEYFRETPERDYVRSDVSGLRMAHYNRCAGRIASRCQGR